MNYLKEYRQSQNISQKGLAEKMGVAQATVSEWESGDSSPRVDKISRLAAILNVTEGEIITAIMAAKNKDTA